MTAVWSRRKIMATPFVGEIKLFAGNFAPQGWAFCNGQLLPVEQNEQLFILIGTTYGGDGQEDFALPDLQGRVPIHMGNGIALGEPGGVETATLFINQMAAHSHQVNADSRAGTQASPGGGLPGALQNAYSDSTTTATGMAQTMLSPAGGSQPHENMQPFLVVSYIISLFGTMPQQG
jgi:microcystin-dependent protein